MICVVAWYPSCMRSAGAFGQCAQSSIYVRSAWCHSLGLKRDGGARTARTQHVVGAEHALKLMLAVGQIGLENSQRASPPFAILLTFPQPVARSLPTNVQRATGRAVHGAVDIQL